MSVALATQLRDYFTEFEATLVPIDVEHLVTEHVPHRPGERRRRPIPGWAVAVAAFAVVLLAFGAIAWLGIFAGDEAPPAEETTTTTTIESPATTVAPQPTVGAWNRVGADVMQPVVGIFDIATGPDGLVVSGFDPGDNGRQDGVVFTSGDGQTWERLGEEEPVLTTGAVLMYGIAANDALIVGAGMGCEIEDEPCVAFPRVWSTPDGTTWTRSMPEVRETESSGAILDVVATSDGFVAVGSVYESISENEWVQHAAAWFSLDGITWDRAYTGTEPGPGMQRAAIGPDGRIVAVGQNELEEGEGAGHGIIWTSPDDRNWLQIPDDPAVFGPSADGSQVMLHAVAAGPEGYLVVGTQDGVGAVILRSPDAVTWERVEATTMPDVGSLSAVAAVDGGWVIAGPHGFSNAREDVPAVWASPDGVEWYRAVNLGQGYVMGMVATDTYLAVAGALAGYDNFHAGVWIGPIPDPADFGAAVDEPVVDRVATLLEILGTDAGCTDLTAAGLDYAAVLAYWEYRNQAADMDPDGNGIPCEDAYSALQLESRLGPSDALAVTIEETSVELDGQMRVTTFVAGGPAVDAGLICPGGTGEFLGEEEPQHPQAQWRWQARYTCDDGSGDFVIDVEVLAYSEQALGEYGYARVGAGTGSHADLQGGVGTVTSWETGFTRSSGRVWIGEAPRPEPATSISEAAADLSCTELYAMGYDLVEVVAYAEIHDRPTPLDPDGNGIPCEDAYPAAEVEDLFGPPDALDVTIRNDSEAMTFTATGAAVDAAIVCSSGRLEDLDGRPSGFPRVEATWRSRYVCDDGSGSFILAVAGYRFEFGTTSYGVGTIEEPTGDLAGLRAGGGVVLDFDPASQTFTGRAWVTAG